MAVGQDTLDWKKIFTAAKTGGIKNYFVEMNLEMMKASVPYLRRSAGLMNLPRQLLRKGALQPCSLEVTPSKVHDDANDPVAQSIALDIWRGDF